MSLGPSLPTASSSLPGTHEACASRSGQLLRPLFGLAPGGVYHATPVTRSAVRSYRTVSPLPVLPEEPSAVCSLLHFPSPRDARPLAGTLPCGARTFLDTRRCRDPHSPPISKLSKMPRRGLEPPRRFRHQILSLACLPISAPGLGADAKEHRLRGALPKPPANERRMLPRGLEPPRAYAH
jgi:hypothetical protein